MKPQTDWHRHLEQETRKRIVEMEAKDYKFPPAFSQLDWILAALTIVASGAFLLAGASM